MADASTVVVAVDFGSSFSGFAYALPSQPHKVFKYYDWPRSAGSWPSCKTPSTLLYAPSPSQRGRFFLQDWGTSALVRFLNLPPLPASSATQDHVTTRALAWLAEALSELSMTPATSGSTQFVGNDLFDVSSAPQSLTKNARSFLVTRFKLCLAPGANNQAFTRQLPGDITVERMITDYLRCLSDFIISELRTVCGKHLGKQDVQWCLTVPSIWEERSKVVMKVCAEKAGMVTNALDSSPSSSPKFPLGIVLEPEAASVYCQQCIDQPLNLKKGDKMLVVDAGSGIIDCAVHERANHNHESLRLEEVCKSYGEIGGSSFVDSHFFKFVSQRIACFEEICRENPSNCISIYEWWQGVKVAFDGSSGYSAEMMLPQKLSDAWEKHHRMRGVERHDSYYKVLKLKDTDIMSIFNPEVHKVVNLIDKHIESVRVLLVVGGFAASAYLRKMIQSHFEGRVEEVVIAEDPGSAICHGAVQLYMGKNIIGSRISKKTYGLRVWTRADDTDPPQYVHRVWLRGGRRMCEGFQAFVREGDRVPCNASFTQSFTLFRYVSVKLQLISSPNKNVVYAERPEVVKETEFEVFTGHHRSVKVAIVFGASFIHVTTKFPD